MNIKDYYFVADLLHERSGLVLGEDKAYLVQSRLSTVTRKWAFADLEVLVATLRHEPPEDLIDDVVESMVTTDTCFFRDKRPFDHFRQVDLPALVSRRPQDRAIRLWSAGCATGQEAYSLSMLVSEAGVAEGEREVEILASDLSRQCLAKARSGIYTQFEAQRGLPIRSLLAHFAKVGDKWQIDEGLKRRITFEQVNLLSSFDELPTEFDAIFCRNVLKFFDRRTRAQILEALVDRLAPEGRLYLGCDEIAEGLTDRLVALPDAHGVYASVGGEGRTAGTPDQPAIGLAS